MTPGIYAQIKGAVAVAIASAASAGFTLDVKMDDIDIYRNVVDDDDETPLYTACMNVSVSFGGDIIIGKKVVEIEVEI
jgi:hypothetical protein